LKPGFNLLIFKVSNINSFVRLRAEPNILEFLKSMRWSECFCKWLLTSEFLHLFWTWVVSIQSCFQISSSFSNVAFSQVHFTW